MLSKRVVLVLVALSCLFALSPSAVRGQAASSGTVAGTVTDPSGAAVVGATVTLTDTATSIARTATANEAGRYIFANVAPGTYNITINKSGFRLAKLSDQVVNIGSALTLNVALELGSTTEVVEVTATGAELQVLNATVGNTVSGDLLTSLPSIGRDSSTFVTLQPGVSPDGSVAGAVVDQSTFLLDGGQNTNDMDGSMQVYTPSFAGDPTGGIVSNSIGGAPTGVMPTPLDSIEEFKVNTANQTADFNSSAGAQVQVVTRRGTNAWHGSAYEYYFDNNFNANTWDNNASGTKLPSFHYNRFGASGGGPVISKNLLGGKTYFFANYEGFRWKNSATVERVVPTATMRAGILTFGGVQYNLNTGTNCGPSGGIACDPRGIGINQLLGGPNGMWTKWMPLPNEPNAGGGGCGGFAGSSRCDGVNEQGFKANMSLPYTSNFGVARLDHDFGAKWHFTSSYRYYKLVRTTNSQVDIGGFFSGDALGVPTALSHRPQQPWYLVAGLTTNITPNTTNDFHFSYLRNYWSWADKEGPPQFSQLGGALEPFGESATTALLPYNVNTQSVRTRFWDGQDRFFRDDVTMLKGNHLFTFGGSYQHNYDWHQRSDNGGGINYMPTYQLGDSTGGGNVDFSSTQPAGVSASRWARNSAAVLGIVTDAQVAYTREGATLKLNAPPPFVHAFDQSTIPYYNVYWSDSWHMKPSFTLTYGLGWTLEMPPVEKNGKQIELVDQAGQQLDEMAYMNAKKAAALQGQVYNPQVGFALVGNTGGGQKYPYMPYYGSFSPRVAAAWNPNISEGFLGRIFGGNKSVARGGYSRVYGRLNGVDLVLVPLLGTGLIQPVQCRNNMMPTSGFPNGSCGGTITVANAFRVGTDGNVAPIPLPSSTLPQPTFPGINNASAAAGEALDPHFRPNVVDSFDFTIQRQLSNKILLEVGYIGRRITHEYQPVNINAVPYMMTLGGQRFDKAYAAIESALGCATSYNACGAAVPSTKICTANCGTATPTLSPNPAYAQYFNALPTQAFFEAAMVPAACSGSYAGVAMTTCTANMAFHELGSLETQSVWSVWSDLDNGSFNFPRSMLNTPLLGGPLDCGTPPGTATCGGNGQLSSGVGDNASIGHGNYNGAFVSLKVTNWHGLTLQENFTYSKALGTGAFVQATSEYTPNDPFNLDNMYGVQNFDRKFVFNVYAMYDPPFYKGQHGLAGHILGGWTFSPVFAAGSGAPVYCNTNTDAQSFGGADGANFFDNEQCIYTGAHPGSASLHRDGNAGEFNILAADPSALFDTIRNPILGLDRGTGGVGAIRGSKYWNMDARVTKNIKIWERVGLDFQFVVTNVFNHPVFFDPSLDPTAFTPNSAKNPFAAAASFGSVSSQGNNPRQYQFGLRFSF